MEEIEEKTQKNFQSFDEIFMAILEGNPLSSKSDMYLTNNFLYLVAKNFSVKFKVESFKMINVKVCTYVLIITNFKKAKLS